MTDPSSPLPAASEEGAAAETPPKRAYTPAHTRTAGYRNFVVQDRDLLVLRYLNQCRFLRLGQIQRLVFPGRSIQPARRRLRYLFQGGYVGRCRPEVKVGEKTGQAETAYYLTKLGAELLTESCPEIEVKWYAKSATVKTLFLRHALDVSEFFVHLELACRDSAVVRLRRFVADFELKSHVKNWSSPERFKLYQAFAHPQTQEQFSVYPDILFILEGRGEFRDIRRLFLVEVDRGTQSLSKLRRKIIGYSLMKTAGGQAKFGPFRSFRVLFQCNSPRRLVNIRQHVLPHLVGGNLVWLADVREVNSASVLTEPIWTDAGGQKLSIVRG